MKPTIRTEAVPTYQQYHSSQMVYISPEPLVETGGYRLETGESYYVDAVVNIYTTMVFARVTCEGDTRLLVYNGLQDFDAHWSYPMKEVTS